MAQHCNSCVFKNDCWFLKRASNICVGLGAVCVSLLTLGVSLGEGVTGCLTESCSDDSDLQGLA